MFSRCSLESIVFVMIFESGTSDFIYFHARIMRIHRFPIDFMKKPLFKVTFFKNPRSVQGFGMNFMLCLCLRTSRDLRESLESNFEKADVFKQQKV